MKKIIYICSVLCLALVSCQSDDLSEPPVSGSKDKTVVNFTLNISEYQAKRTKVSYENAINNLWLMVFDSNGLFIERVEATDLVAGESNGVGSGSFKAEISNKAGIIHFIANYSEWPSFNDRDVLQKDERELIPALASDKLIFWGRNVVTSLTAPMSVTLYRNQAKITVENQATNFTLTGYAIANYITTGTVAPFNTEANPTPFVVMDNVPTIPGGTINRGQQNDSDCTMEPKYMFENENSYNNQTYIIIKGHVNNGADQYYKIQLLDSLKHPYPVIRNYNYRVLIKSFSSNANGSTSFTDAQNAEPSNNIYAEISKSSPSIADNNNNILTVSKLNFLFTQAGTLNVAAHYTKNGANGDAEITVAEVEDPANIIQNLNYDRNGNITANIAKVSNGQQQATITVKAGVLSRTITVISSVLYQFDPITLTPNVYTSRDQDVTLSFTMPNNIPSDLYPLKCEIKTDKLYPVAPNKDLQIEYIDGTYKYVYWAYNAGRVSLNFKTSFENSDETITIENEIFKTGTVDLKSRHFTNASINNGSNIVNYGTNSQATLAFSIADIAGSPATYPLTVFIATNNLKTTQSGWNAVAGGYSRTYTSAPSGTQTVAFTSNKNISKESIVISADGFSNTTVTFDNVLTSNTANISNNMYVYTNGQNYQIPRYNVTSSNTNAVASFRTSNNSTYSFVIKSGAHLSDMVTFTSSGYTGSYTVEQLLAAPQIILK